MTPLEIDPGTVRLVSQCLNQYATPGALLHKTEQIQLRVTYPFFFKSRRTDLFSRLQIAVRKFPQSLRPNFLTIPFSTSCNVRAKYNSYGPYGTSSCRRCCVSMLQRVPLATEPGISLIILTPMKILQRNLNRSTFVV